ncbi:erythromycin esterase family protein [Streptomyces sp. 891-h]|uniref:erythromycin esterase family protein n=1 Tax=Streptomyces sp. 891-h TaxID=2720714 RepID=UPI001FA9C0D1|nr:erythromycin esterase family protein [Streptomyces sp. 891-h]
MTAATPDPDSDPGTPGPAPGTPGPAPRAAETLDRVRADALPLTGTDSLDPLLEHIGDSRYVLVGEASHGTTGFYRWRALLTRRLIEEKGFTFVAVEGDWPDCQALHCAVTAAPGAPSDPVEALEGFDRWPTWMWANTEVATFSRWLRDYNTTVRPARPVGFFGLDVYSLWESLRAVLAYLREHAPDRVEHALEAYRCFEPYAADPQSYAMATRLVPAGCEREVLDLLTELRGRVEAVQTADSGLAEFAARQNAEVLAGAERYYRTMIGGGPEAWNIRDTHMADTLDRLMEHHGPEARAVVWAHNTHVGDARATDMADVGMVNLGRLVRERHETEGVTLVGFSSYQGSVVAAPRWAGEPRVMRVPPAKEGSIETLLHDALADRPSTEHSVEDGRALFLVPPGHRSGVPIGARSGWLWQERDHRAVGVVYDPRREEWGNYVPTVLGERYDALLHLDHSEALTPLREAPLGEGQLGEGEEATWPSGV